MKKFTIIVFTLIALLGCGGGGGGTGATKSEPILANASTSNALKTYDVLAVSTYMPSFLTKLRHIIANDGVAASTNCNTSGSIEVMYDYPNAQSGVLPVYGANASDVKGTYNFLKCTIKLSGNTIYLNGTLQDVTYKTNLNIFTARIKDGFIFTQTNPNEQIEMVYKTRADEKRSYFASFYKNEHGVSYVLHTRFVEKNLNDVSTKLSLGDNKDGYYTDVPKGIFYLHTEGDYIQFENNEFFNITGIESNTKLLLSGVDEEVVEVWQDETDAVHAKIGDEEEYSFTTYTPKF